MANEIMVGEWTVTGQCTICGSPYLSRPSYSIDSVGLQDSKPETISSCKCFEKQKEISRPENSVSRVVKLRTTDNKGEEEHIYTITSTNPSDKIQIDEDGNFNISISKAGTRTIDVSEEIMG